MQKATNKYERQPLNKTLKRDGAKWKKSSPVAGMILPFQWQALLVSIATPAQKGVENLFN